MRPSQHELFECIHVKVQLPKTSLMKPSNANTVEAAIKCNIGMGVRL